MSKKSVPKVEDVEIPEFMQPTAPPPIDNDHVAQGAEKFKDACDPEVAELLRRVCRNHTADADAVGVLARKIAHRYGVEVAR